jgi:hypothetical protein
MHMEYRKVITLVRYRAQQAVKAQHKAAGRWIHGIGLAQIMDEPRRRR